MPHVIIKLVSGRTEQQKIQLSQEIVKDVMGVLNCKDEAVSLAIEEIKPEDWTEKVYKKDIQSSFDKLYKKPGYGPFK